MQGYNSYFVGESKVLVHNCFVKIKKALWGDNDYRGIGNQKGIDHILDGHSFGARKGEKSSRFNQSNSNIKSIKEMVNEAVAKGIHAGSEGNYTITHTFDRVIGTTSSGKKTKTIKIYLDDSGKVLNAYPVK